MAVLGFQLVTTLVAASVLSKIVTYFSFTRFLYDGLMRFAVPTDDQLLSAIGNHKTRNKTKKRRPEANNSGLNGDADIFYFPRTMTIPLHPTSISHIEAVPLPLYSSCQWLLDFTVCSLCVFFITEAAHSPFMPWYQVPRMANHSATATSLSNSTVSLPAMISFSTRINLSIVWLSLTVWFTLRTLLSMTGIYFRRSNPETARSDSRSSSSASGHSSSSEKDASTAEWLLVLCAGFIFLVITGFVLALDGRFFDFNLHEAYGNLTVGPPTATAAPLITWGAFQSMIALTCALIGAVYVYPGLKFGKIYLDTVNNDSTPWGKRMLLHLTFISPLFPIFLWVDPVIRHLVDFLSACQHNPLVAQQPLLLIALNLVCECLGQYLGTTRLFACLFVVILRCLTTRCNLQTYLNSAKDKLNRFNREPGRTSNREVQRLVASIFYCMNLVALQYIAPTILLLAMVCLYKTVAGLSWFPVSSLTTDMSGFTAADTHPPTATDPNFGRWISNDPSTNSDSSWLVTVSQARLAFSQFTEVFAVRAMAVSRGVFGFLVWWCLTALQSVSLLGLAYHRFASI
ncbi:hypothetical protein FBUS_04762 [Fasciolopsis buskii]|uniref:Transmembrane protein 161B n=1 Tax=Fasciolopsis buskii TaxID=27845 RepID=A0A8E0VPI8_9TREM|nr:hypothetical protein FBUS_04762 [Fasciolopsis buski]